MHDVRRTLNLWLVVANNVHILLVAVHTWRILGVVFLWGVYQGILHPTFGIPAGVGRYFDWSDSNSLRIVLKERIQFQTCCHSLEHYRDWGFNHGGHSWFDHCFWIWHFNNDNFPVDSNTYLGGTPCTSAAWNYSLPSKKHRISVSTTGDGKLIIQNSNIFLCICARPRWWW